MNFLNLKVLTEIIVRIDRKQYLKAAEALCTLFDNQSKTWQRKSLRNEGQMKIFLIPSLERITDHIHWYFSQVWNEKKKKRKPDQIE